MSRSHALCHAGANWWLTEWTGKGRGTGGGGVTVLSGNQLSLGEGQQEDIRRNDREHIKCIMNLQF